MDVSMKQLRVFLAIVETRNFSLAGEQVGLSQPAVSRAIRELEARLDVRLFDRSTREVRLSEAGEILSQRLPRWMDELDHILLDLSDWAGSRRGKVRVASSPTISAHLMPYSLARCAEAEPDIEVMLLDRIQQDVLASVLTGEVDFGVIVEPSQAQLRELHSERIMLDPFCAVLPKDHRLAKKHPHLKWAELDGQSLVLLDQASGSRRLIDDALRQFGVQHEVSQQVGHATTGFEMVRAGLGVSVMPGLAIPPEGLNDLVVVPLFPRVERRIMLVHRKNRSLSPLVQSVWNLIKRCVEERASNG